MDPEKRMKIWLANAFGAVVCFCSCNAFMSYLTARTDAITTIFYMGPGMLLTGVVFQLFMIVRRISNPSLPDYTSKGKPHDGCWHPHNIIVDGKLDCLNLLRFFIQVLLFIINLGSILLCMHYAHLGGVNVGVITAIWGIQPLITAILDKLMYDEPFLPSYAIGIFLMICSTVCISLKSPDIFNDRGITVEGFPIWPAILLGLITPCIFCTVALYNKHVTSSHVGFDATTLTLGSSSVGGAILVLVSAFWYFRYVVKWDMNLFWYGLGASILDTIG
jgi:drug/metabolite transporter (DMT)-like permease